MTLSLECRDEQCEHYRRMPDDGWDVHWGLKWTASAPRGGVSEETVGDTREEVLQR